MKKRGTFLFRCIIKIVGNFQHKHIHIPREVDVHHRINGCPINLRTLTEGELATLIEATADRIAAVQEELDSLVGERIRRGNNVIPLFDVPPYLRDPA